MRRYAGVSCVIDMRSPKSQLQNGSDGRPRWIAFWAVPALTVVILLTCYQCVGSTASLLAVSPMDSLNEALEGLRPVDLIESLVVPLCNIAGAALLIATIKIASSWLQREGARGRGPMTNPEDFSMERKQRRITPVILSGGTGSRLWPLSRPERPKQLLRLTGSATMLQLTAERTCDRSRFSAPVIVANAGHLLQIERQLSEIGVTKCTLILEPDGRNTAPAITLAALSFSDPTTVMLVMPSDHVIQDVAAFHAAIATALPLVEQGWLCTFGISPDGPATGYGYIKAGDALAEGAQRAERFVEKPDHAAAEAMLEKGGYFWNAGIFLFRADAILDAVASHSPEVLHAVAKAYEHRIDIGSSAILPDRQCFALSPSVSIDYAVMERAARVAVVPTSMGWSDVGTWDSLYDLSARDADGNSAEGNAILVDVKNCLVRSDGARVALVGMEDAIVIASGKDILVLARGRSEDIRNVTQRIGRDSSPGLPSTGSGRAAPAHI